MSEIIDEYNKNQELTKEILTKENINFDNQYAQKTLEKNIELNKEFQEEYKNIKYLNYPHSTNLDEQIKNIFKYDELKELAERENMLFSKLYYQEMLSLETGKNRRTDIDGLKYLKEQATQEVKHLIENYNKFSFVNTNALEITEKSKKIFNNLQKTNINPQEIITNNNIDETLNNIENKDKELFKILNIDNKISEYKELNKYYELIKNFKEFDKDSLNNFKNDLMLVRSEIYAELKKSMETRYDININDYFSQDYIKSYINNEQYIERTTELNNEKNINFAFDKEKLEDKEEIKTLASLDR